ncbi:MAG: tyrosine-type recombinase/integrase [Steroidobacteraceae bacterium]
MAVLSAVYSKAVGRWYCAQTNPCAHVERNPSSRRTRYITDEEYLAFYQMLPERIRLGMDLAFVTGQRQGDILAMKWDQVSEEGIRLQQGKTGKKLLIGLSPTLQAILDRCKALLPHLPREYVLRTRKGKGYTGEGFRACWQRTMRKAIKGYTRGGEKFPPVLTERFSYHDLRAKCVSDSVSLDAAFERAGHTTMAMTRSVYDRNYRKVTPLK